MDNNNSSSISHAGNITLALPFMNSHGISIFPYLTVNVPLASLGISNVSGFFSPIYTEELTEIFGLNVKLPVDSSTI